MIKEKILNGEELTEQELKHIIWEDIDEDIKIVDTQESAMRRWSIYIYYILQIEDRYFRIAYDKGLTEMQEDSYYPMVAIEVEPYEVVTTDWRIKK